MTTSGLWPRPDPPEQKRLPANVVEGLFSVYSAVAAAARRPYDWRGYDLMDDPGARDLTSRTSARLVPGIGAGMRSVVTLRTRDGMQHQREVSYPKGEPENPMTWEEMQEKFTEWSEGIVGASRARNVVDQVGALETMISMHDLTANLRTP